MVEKCGLYTVNDGTKKETNSKRSTTNSTNKCNIQIMGILKTKIEHHIISDTSKKKVNYKQELLKKIEESQTTY